MAGSPGCAAAELGVGGVSGCTDFGGGIVAAGPAVEAGACSTAVFEGA